jgi:hypothetical protein
MQHYGYKESVQGIVTRCGRRFKMEERMERASILMFSMPERRSDFWK